MAINRMMRIILIAFQLCLFTKPFFVEMDLAHKDTMRSCQL